MRWGRRLTTYGPWWLNVQRYDSGEFGVFRGLKVGPLALYVRWNTPDASSEKAQPST